MQLTIKTQKQSVLELTWSTTLKRLCFVNLTGIYVILCITLIKSLYQNWKTIKYYQCFFYFWETQLGLYCPLMGLRSSTTPASPDWNTKTPSLLMLRSQSHQCWSQWNEACCIYDLRVTFSHSCLFVALIFQSILKQSAIIKALQSWQPPEKQPESLHRCSNTLI